MTRIVTTTYRYKPPQKRNTSLLTGPAIVTPMGKRGLLPEEGQTLEPAAGRAEDEALQ